VGEPFDFRPQCRRDEKSELRFQPINQGQHVSDQPLGLQSQQYSQSADQRQTQSGRDFSAFCFVDQDFRLKLHGQSDCLCLTRIQFLQQYLYLLLIRRSSNLDPIEVI